MQIDPALLKLSASGERQAQYKLYKQSFSLLMSICSRYTINKDDAMALVNLGFCKILMHANKYKEHIPIEMWMRRIMINTAIDEFRRNKKYKEQTQLQDFSDHVSGSGSDESDMNLYDAEIEAERLEDMLKNLPTVTGKVFNLFAIDGYSHKEISNMLHMSEGTSKWHVNNARTLLKQMLKKVM
ncbi:MAG: RNA polymerase sigma factor [Chitinophagales bacterium]|nr:RNA polymerase sigma factor [Chitinophagales bacterium]